MSSTTQKPGFIQRTKTFFDEVRVEMGKVVWPSKETLRVYTTVVIVSTAVVAALMGVWDNILGWIMEQLILRI